MMYEGLKNKVVLITGASSGIGAGAAEIFAKHGSQLVLHGRNAEKLEKVAQRCTELGIEREKILTVTAELANPEEVSSLVEKAIGKFTRLDILVANAGIGPAGTLETSTLEQYDEVHNVNLRSVYVLFKAAMPHLIASKGTVVAVSSDSAYTAHPSMTAYCVSKAGLDHLVRCAALEVASKGVRVNGINPAAIWTDVFEKFNLLPPGDPKEQFDAVSKGYHALGRGGTVEETGKLIAFLASDDASFITGQNISIDGGASLLGPGGWE